MAGGRCIVCDTPEPFPLLFARGPYRLVRCPTCGLVFQHPQPDDEALTRSYQHDPEFARALLGPLRQTTLQRARDKLVLLRNLGVDRPGVRTLDVGCSSGAWLEVAAARGMAATGIEPGAETAAQARSRGLDVRTGTLQEAASDLAGERFDLITFWDVLEHLRDPRAELSLAASMLAPDGLLAATCPNVDGWYPRLTYRLFATRTGVWEYPEVPVHLYDFSPSTARRLLERTGYQVVEVKTTTTPYEHYRSTTLSPRDLGRGWRSSALRLGFDALRLVVYPLARLCDRGNAMFVAGRPSSRMESRPVT